MPINDEIDPKFSDVNSISRKAAIHYFTTVDNVLPPRFLGKVCYAWVEAVDTTGDDVETEAFTPGPETQTRASGEKITTALFVTAHVELPNGAPIDG